MKTKLMLFGLILSVSLPSAFAKDPFKAKEFKTPLREISIIASDDGFYPNKVMGYVGEKVRFFITSTSSKKQCFLLQKHEVFMAAEKGKISEAYVRLEHAGRYKFYCPSTKFTGHLTVFDKNKSQESETSSREPASVKPNYWLPRDFD